MAGENIAIEAGFDVIYYGINDIDGIPLGGTGIAVAGDIDGSPFLRLDGAQTVDMSLPEDEVVTALGDDDRMVSFSFQGANEPQGAMEVASKDLVAMGRFIGVPHRDIAGTVQLPMGGSSEKANLAVLFQRQAKSWQGGYMGVKKRAALYVPSCEIQPLGAPYNQRSLDAQRFSINASNASRHQWGETFCIADDTVESAPVINITSPELLHIHAFRGDAARVLFDLLYTPLLPATNMVVTVEGVVQAYTGAYAVATNQITFVAAPAADARIIAYYQFDRSEL